jgi:GLTT repeat (6 copies)
VRRYPDSLCLLIVARPGIEGPPRAATAAISAGLVSMGQVSMGQVSMGLVSTSAVSTSAAAARALRA